MTFSSTLEDWSRGLSRVFVSGNINEAPFSLLKMSKDFGVIHLLVLSGSQVHFFSWVSKAFWAPILRRIFRIDERVQRLFLGVFLIAWVGSFDFPPPLTRALLFELVNLYSVDFKMQSLAPRMILIHALCFPAHLLTSGFYLSWASFLLVCLLGESSKSRILSTILATVLCTALFRICNGGQWPTLFQWIGIIVANLTLGWIAEKLWFPMLAGFHFFAFLGSTLGIISDLESRDLGIDLLSRLVAPFLLPFIP